MDVEDATDAAFIDAGAKHLRGAAQSQQYLDRADDQALSRAGRAGEAVQARVQLDSHIGNHRQVRDVQFAKQCLICGLRFAIEEDVVTEVTSPADRRRSQIANLKSQIPQLTFAPGATFSVGETTMTRPVPGSVAASNIPLLISPRIWRGARFATTTICFPTSCSGG